MNGIAEMESFAAAVDRGELTDAAMINQDVALTSMLQRIAAQTKPIAAASNVKEKSVDEQVWSIPGFGAGARVQTSFGLVPVEALRIGDPIKTSTGNFLRAEYVDEIRLDRRFLLTHPESQPITIPKDAFGASCPSRNISVSGAQEVRLPGNFDQMQGTTAVSLIGQRRICRDLSGYFNYYVFHCGEPCTVCIDGLWVNIKPSSPDTSID